MYSYVNNITFYKRVLGYNRLESFIRTLIEITSVDLKSLLDILRGIYSSISTFTLNIYFKYTNTSFCKLHSTITYFTIHHVGQSLKRRLIAKIHQEKVSSTLTSESLVSSDNFFADARVTKYVFLFICMLTTVRFDSMRLIFQRGSLQLARQVTARNAQRSRALC